MTMNWDDYQAVSNSAPRKPWVPETTSTPDPEAPGEPDIIHYTGTLMSFNPDSHDADPFDDLATVTGPPEVIEFVATASEALPHALNTIRAIEELHAPVPLDDLDGTTREVVCAECCIYDDGLTEECATTHQHSREPLLRCDTIKVIYGVNGDVDEE